MLMILKISALNIMLIITTRIYLKKLGRFEDFDNFVFNEE